jgi:hypothetical protein
MGILEFSVDCKESRHFQGSRVHAVRARIDECVESLAAQVEVARLRPAESR